MPKSYINKRIYKRFSENNTMQLAVTIGILEMFKTVFCVVYIFL